MIHPYVVYTLVVTAQFILNWKRTLADLLNLFLGVSRKKLIQLLCLLLQSLLVYHHLATLQHSHLETQQNVVFGLVPKMNLLRSDHLLAAHSRPGRSKANQ